MPTTTILEQDLNPIAFQIGSLIGLLTRQTDETYTLNSQWFNDPWEYISAIPRKPEMFQLLQTLMGSSTGNSLGTPRQISGHDWYPILIPPSGSNTNSRPTGVYIVATKPEPGKRTDFGFGVLYDWTYDSFSLLPYAYFPLIALPLDENDSFEFILGQDGHPVEAGIEITGSNGVFNTGSGINSLSFDGFQAGSQIYFANGKYPSLDLVFLNLKLPGEKQGSNRSLSQLIASASVQNSITMALAVLGAQLSQSEGPAGTAGKMINSLLELLGLLGPIPGIDWNALVKDPSSVIKILTTWLQDIAGNNNTLKTWLNDWYCLFKGLDSTIEANHIPGAGTREAPFIANLFHAEFTPGLSIDINLSFAAVKTPEGALKLYPGFQVLTSPITPIPSLPAFGVRVAAAAEVLCYTIPISGNPSAGDIQFFPGYSIMASAANTTIGQPLFSVADVFGQHARQDSSDGKFSIGSMNIGFVYDEITGGKASKVPSPDFKLFSVQTAIGSWPVIDLSNFNVNTIEEAIGPVVTQAILSFFGEDNPYALALTAILGIAAPTSFSGEWPLNNQLLLSPDQLALLIRNPFAAIGAYYARCLSTRDKDGQTLFSYLVPGFATLLGSNNTQLSGDGTRNAPWLITLLTVGTASLNLAIYRTDDEDLTIAFNFSIPLPITSVAVTFDLNAEMFVMQLPGADGSGIWNGSWMQSLTGKLLIAPKTGDKLQTPAIGGVSLSVKDVFVEGGWTNADNFFTVATIETVRLNAGSFTIDMGNISFSSAQWNIDQLKQFTPAITAGMGLLMLQNGGRPGVTLATLLGTLPNLPQIFDGQSHDEYNFPIPQGLELPADWPVLTIRDFQNPWNDIIIQLSALYKGGSKFMEPAMRLIGWMINGQTPDAPIESPAGTLVDPWSVNLPDIFNIDLLTWIQDGQTGYGMQRPFARNVTGTIQIASVLRADCPGFTLAGSDPANGKVYPGISLLNIIANAEPGKPLLDAGGITIGKAQLGGYSFLKDGQPGFTPLFRFLDSDVDPDAYSLLNGDSRFDSIINLPTDKAKPRKTPVRSARDFPRADGLQTYETISLSRPGRNSHTPSTNNDNDTLSDYVLIPVPGKPQFTCEQGMEAFDSLVYALMDQLSATLDAAGFPQLKALLDLLQLLGIVDITVVEKEPTHYAFNPGGWASLLANPGGYLSTKTLQLLQDPPLCSELMTTLAGLLGYKDFTLPTTWQGIQYLLQSLSLAVDYNGFFVPALDPWLELIKDPVGYLQQSVSQLFNDPDLITQLVSSLAKLLPSDDRHFSVDPTGMIITVQIPPTSTALLGQDIRLFATSVIDVKALTLTNHVAIGSTILSSAIGFTYSPAFKDGQLTHDYAFYLEGLPDVSPVAFPPLPIWPFPADKQAYWQQLGYQIPLTLLSSFATQYLNDFVAPANPAVINIFKTLGLTASVDGENIQIMPLIGIFMHPVDWLFSPQVLGNEEGGIDLSKLGNLLYTITAAGGVSNGNIKLQPYEHDSKKDGVSLTGLPWGVSFTLYANTEEGIHLQGNFVPSLPSPAPDIHLTGAVTFANGNGVGIEGAISMGYNLGNNTSGQPTTLSITAAYAKKAFVLTAMADTTEFKLLPFGGLNQFLNAGTAGFLLKIIGDKLFGAYDQYVLQNPNTPLKPFVLSIETLTGITDGNTLYQFFNNIYNDPLGQFNEANIKTLLPRINEFLTTILTLQGFSIVSNGNLLQYEHTFASLPNAKVTILVGLQTIDSVTVFGIWLQPMASFQWVSLGLNRTGVGVVMPVNYDSPDLRFEVGVTVATDLSSFKIPNAPQPSLVFGLSGDLSGIRGPNLDLYPVSVSQDPGTISIKILPSPQLLIAGQSNVTTIQWMISFGVEFLLPFVANTALAQAGVKRWLDDTTIGTVKGAPGQVLTTWGLLGKTDGAYYLTNLRKTFNVSDPVSIVTSLIFSALNLLDGQRVVPIGDHGIYVKSDTSSGGTRFGLRIQIPDIVVTSSLNSDGARLSLQLGKYYDGQDANNNWTGLKTEPGAIVYFINRRSDNSLSFTPKFELVSVGLDFAGANAQKPLVNVKGVSIQSIEPRAYVSLDIDGLKTDFGAGILLGKMAIPLGPGFNHQGSDTNPVAQNLLTSGGNPGETDAINPAFSVSVSYITNSKTFTLQLYDANDIPTDKVWIPIMRAFGPLHCRKIGIGWKNDANPKRLDFLFDGDVALAGLAMDLMELGIGIPITDPTNYAGYSLDLAGINISYDAGAVAIGGGFLKDDSRGYIQYIGQAMIRAGVWGLGAFGAYALVDEHPSLFIFAYLNAPLGGPPFFYVKGLSGGFGYNRTINIPPANRIESFPFVAGITNPSKLGGTNGNPPTSEEALRALGNDIVPPELGSYWLAAGIMLSSFELIDCNAVLMVIFGNDFEIGLLGLAGLVLPKTGPTYVGAQIAFKVTYKVSTGLLALEAVLTSNSYVIDRNCRLTGGLAFYLWFKDQLDSNAKAGEFVFTLGGYNPRFNKPDYFPDMPRLGFSWSVSNTISIKGGAYFAMTPSAVMAGGSLEAVFQQGALKAWFTAYADFLIMWNPFYYDISIGVSVGASYTVKFIWTTTFKVELGASLHIWGPEMAGSVTVKWWVISFTVDFGASGTSPNDSRIIEWTDFKGYFLPADQPPPPPPQQLPEDPAAKSTLADTIGNGFDKSKRQSIPSRPAGKAINQQSAPPVQQVTHIRQVAGLIKELDDNGTTVWQINPGGFVYSISSVIPLNEIDFANSGNMPAITSNVAFGIRPLGSVTFGAAGQRSTMQLSMTYNSNPLGLTAWEFTAELNGVPESLWGTVNDGKTNIDAKIVPNALVGLTARLSVTSDNLPKNGPPMFPLSNLGYAPWPLRKLTLANNPALKPTSPARHSDESLKIIEDTIMNDVVVDKRIAILEAVLSAGINVKTDGRLDQMAAYATITFQSFPMLGELGSIALGANTLKSAPKTVRLNRTYLLAHKTIPLARTAAIKPLMTSAQAQAQTQATSTQAATISAQAQPASAQSNHPSTQTQPTFAQPTVRAITLQYARPTLLSPVFMGASLSDIKATRPVKGTMYSPDMTPDWQNAAVRLSSTIAPQVYTIYAGMSMILDLEPSPGNTPLIPDGSVPVFGAWFDTNNQLIDSRILNGPQSLAKDTTQLILTGLSTADLKLPFAYGWHITSQLTLVNPNALTGIGTIIVPDSPIRIQYLRRSGSFGLIRGSEMVKRNRFNRTLTVDGVTRQETFYAGIETILPGGLHTVAVLLMNEGEATPDSILVRLAFNTPEGPDYRTLHPATTIVGQMETALLFTLPEDTGYTYFSIHTSPLDKGCRVVGIMGLSEAVPEVQANWNAVVLQPPLPDQIDDAQTLITIG